MCLARDVLSVALSGAAGGLSVSWRSAAAASHRRSSSPEPRAWERTRLGSARLGSVRKALLMSFQEFLREGQEVPSRILSRLSQVLSSLSVSLLGSPDSSRKSSSCRGWAGE
ncbi:hypothetical protein AAFF_G00432760 [Aldrovandia affinis]|uniref:Uncharacterized protein n=1 Tax=Aldrovandia affinis TaxID=143900 RepID=A0AAD7S8J0_9TELE|nr:hypothetical protein AAFF_G00432760 [Aldrovandia affinis]